MAYYEKGDSLYSTYLSFLGMKERVLRPYNNPRNKNYYDHLNVAYKPWFKRRGFQVFLKDMGKRPSHEYTLDRIDSSKGYSPENCRWADKTIQTYNSKIREDNTSGHKGVWREKKLQKWRACLQYKGRRKSLGCYSNKEDAIKAYQKAKLDVYKEV